jgi:hypothetical protein
VRPEAVVLLRMKRIRFAPHPLELLVINLNLAIYRVIANGLFA